MSLRSKATGLLLVKEAVHRSEQDRKDMKRLRDLT